MRPSIPSLPRVTHRQKLAGVVLAGLAGVAAIVGPGAAVDPSAPRQSPFLAVGDTALARGDLMGALLQYDLAAREHPDRPEPHLRRATALASVGHWALAADAVDHAEERGWVLGHDLAREGYFAGLRRFARSGDPTAPDDLARGLLALHELPGVFAAQLAMQRRLGQHAGMDATLDAWARHTQPRGPRARRVAALALEREGRIEAAITMLLAIQDGAEDSVEPSFWRHRELGRMLATAGRTGEAVEQLRLAVALAPLDEESRRLLDELTATGP